MQRSLASRGFTNSGTSGFNTEQLQSQRTGNIASFEGNLVPTMLNQYNTTLSDAMKYAFNPTGSSTTNVGAGSVAAGALGGGLNMIGSQGNTLSAALGAGGGN